MRLQRQVPQRFPGYSCAACCCFVYLVTKDRYKNIPTNWNLSQSTHGQYFQFAVMLHIEEIIGKVPVGIANMSNNPLIKEKNELLEVRVLFTRKLLGSVREIPQTILVFIHVFIVFGVFQKSHQFFFGREMVFYILNRLTCRANETLAGTIRTFITCQLQIINNSDKVRVLFINYRDAKFHARVPSDEVLNFCHFHPLFCRIL
jgi:hypothetical protein